MRAARLMEPGHFQVVDAPAPTPGQGEVVVRVRAAGLCHSDLHIIENELGGFPIPTPITLGHEVAGEVAAVGPGVDAFHPGERVAVFGPNGCGECRYCRRGDDNLCVNNRGGVGLGFDGGYAELVKVPSRSLVPIPEGVSYAEAAVATDAVLTPYHALKHVAGLRAGETIAVIGVGGLGLNGVQVARLLGAYVIAIDVIDEKLELARSHGADEVLNSRKQNPVEALKGRPIDVVADFVGIDATKLQAQMLVDRGGRVVLVGLGSSGGELVGLRFGAEQISVLGSFWGTSRELAEVLELIRLGRIRPQTESHPLEEITQWLERLRKGELTHRAVVVP